mmetsp:Transcript_9386/g.22255  ORF Transcript_9386/g.22255 Transcript_9386/m.22255 type:complete len:234 (-) Transcript_9386:340-1041(-)
MVFSLCFLHASRNNNLFHDSHHLHDRAARIQCARKWDCDTNPFAVWGARNTNSIQARKGVQPDSQSPSQSRVLDLQYFLRVDVPHQTRSTIHGVLFCDAVGAFPRMGVPNRKDAVCDDHSSGSGSRAHGDVYMLLPGVVLAATVVVLRHERNGIFDADRTLEPDRLLFHKFLYSFFCRRLQRSRGTCQGDRQGQHPFHCWSEGRHGGSNRTLLRAIRGRRRLQSWDNIGHRVG